MISIAAFLIILVILFGVETTRSLIFGAFGVLFWVISGVVLLGLAIMAFDSFKKSGKEKRGTSDSIGGWVILLVFAAIVGVGIFNGITKPSEQKKDTFSILKRYYGANKPYTFEGLEFESLETCKNKAWELNMNRPNFDEQNKELDDFAKLARSYRYYCGKNCDHASAEPDKKCEEIID